MGQKICMGSTSWECCWFYMERGLNVRLCSLVYQRCSRSSAKHFLCPAPCNTGPAVPMATKHKVLFWCVREATFTATALSHSHAVWGLLFRESPHTTLYCPSLVLLCPSVKVSEFLCNYCTMRKMKWGNPPSPAAWCTTFSFWHAVW